MTRSAWFCPSCQRHHGPHVDTCPGPVDAVKVAPASPPDHGPWKVPPTNWPPNRKTTFIPGYDDIIRPWVDDPCAKCTGLCGNAFCPKRTVVTMVNPNICVGH